jgi:hypothetical protein
MYSIKHGCLYSELSYQLSGSVKKEMRKNETKYFSPSVISEIERKGFENSSTIFSIQGNVYPERKLINQWFK